MKIKSMFASAAIVATMAAQNAQLVSAVTTDAQDDSSSNKTVTGSDKPSDVNNDVTGNQTNGNIYNNDGSNTANGNDVSGSKDDNKSTTPVKPAVPAKPEQKTTVAPKSSKVTDADGSIGPGFYDKSTVKVAAVTTHAADIQKAVNTTALNIMPVNVNTKSFIDKISAGAISGWTKYKVLPSVTMAQAILESGWGGSTLSTKAYNLFGIKGRYNGQYVVMSTQEQDSNGRTYWVNAEFRKYPSWKESLEDHGRFLNVNSRYKNLLGKTNYKDVTRLLQQDGYATSTSYASTLNNIIETYGLTKYDKQQPATPPTNNSGTPTSGVRYVKNAKGAALYTAPKGKLTGRILAYASGWRIDRSYTANGQTWYRVGTNMWVKGNDVSTGKPTPDKPSAPNKPNKPANPKSKTIKGVKYIKNTKGGKIYNTPFSGNKYVGRTLAYGTAWKVDRVVTVKGQLWYRVGANMWINNADFTAPAAKEKVVKTVKTVKSTSGAKVYKEHNTSKFSGRTLKRNTAWKVDRIITVNGQTWFSVGSAAWVRSADMK